MLMVRAGMGPCTGPGVRSWRPIQANAVKKYQLDFAKLKKNITVSDIAQSPHSGNCKWKCLLFIYSKQNCLHTYKSCVVRGEISQDHISILIACRSLLSGHGGIWLGEGGCFYFTLNWVFIWNVRIYTPDTYCNCCRNVILWEWDEDIKDNFWGRGDIYW